MKYFSNLTAKLGIDISKFNSGLRAASASSTRFSKQVAKDFRKTTTSAKDAGDSFKVFGDAAEKGYKSVRRVAQGIVVSQAFYRVTNAIKDATMEVYNFSASVEESRVAFAGLLKDAEKAERFNAMLQDLAADTPYTYEQAAENARKLVAYEFRIESMERIMTSIADATAASGKVESFSNITEALGQIQAKGRLTARELIRLANAGIPAYQILREEIGLTRDQIANLGKTPVPADIAIPAIIRGMDKRYKGAADAMQRTTVGLSNAIKENLLIILQNAFDPLYQSFRSNMERISNRLESMRKDIRKGGLGYMLENMFPPEVVDKIRLFAANIKMLVQNIIALFRALAPLKNAFLELFVNIFNIIMPIINAFTRVLATLIQMLTSSSRAVRTFVAVVGGLFIINKVIGLILGFTKSLKSLLIVRVVASAISSLTKAIGYLTAAMLSNPLVALISVAIGGALALTVASGKLSSAFDSMSSKLSSAFGVDPSETFQPAMEENTQIAGEFNEELELTSDGLKDAGDKAKEAGKKAKQALMSFDEVFIIPELDDSAGGLDDDIFDIPDIDTPAIPPFDAGGMFPDVGGQIGEWTQGIAKAIKDKLQKALIGAGLGALIGGIIGAAFGGLPGAQLGAKIGGAAGAIVGLFWDELVKFFSTSTGKGAGIGAIIGGIIGAKLGGPIGAAVGAVLGGTAGAIVGHFWDNIKDAFSNHPVGATIGGVIGAIVGAKLGGPIGAVAGGILGASAGMLVSKYWEDIKAAFQTDTGQGMIIGGIVGGLIGTFLTPGKGTLIGAAVGSAAGGLVNTYWDKVKEALEKPVGAAGIIGGVVGAAIGTVLAPGKGTAIGGALGMVAGSLVVNFWDNIKNAFTTGISSAINVGAVVGGILGTILAPGKGTIIGASIGSIAETLVSNFWSSVSSSFDEDSSHERIAEKVSKSFSNISEKAESSTRVKVSDILGLYTELGEKSYDKLYELYLKNTELTEGNWSDLKELTEGEQQSFLDLLDTHKQQELDLIAEAHQTGIITEQSNADELTQTIVDKYDERAEATRVAFESINSVIETSYNDHGILTSEAMEEISGIYAQHNKDIIGEATEHNEKWLGIEAVAYRNIDELDNVELDARLERVRSMFEDEKTDLDNSNQEKLELINDLYAAQLISADEYKDQIQDVWDEYDESYTALEEREAEITEDIIGHKESILDKTIEWVEDTKEGYEDWKDSTSESFSAWKKDTSGTIEDWKKDTKKEFSDWWKDNKKGFNDWKKETYDSITDWYDDTEDKLSTWWKDTKEGFSSWKDTTFDSVKTWHDDTKDRFSDWWKKSYEGFDKWKSDTTTTFEDGLATTVADTVIWSADSLKLFKDWSSDTKDEIDTWVSDTFKKFSGWFTDTKKDFGTWWSDTKGGFTNWARDIYDGVIGWFDRMWDRLKGFFDDLKFWKREAESEEVNVRGRVASSRDSARGYRTYSISPVVAEHARGGTFKKDHIARINEGNKMETILPVENPSAMAKVRQAIFGGEPMDIIKEFVYNKAPQQQLVAASQPTTPIYVNTLIADDRGIRELERKMFEVRQEENQRRGE